MTKKKYCSYWVHNGKYSKELEVLNSFLVPDAGEDSDPRVEAVRCVSNIVHEMYNNGGGNFNDMPDYLDDYIKGLRVPCRGMIKRIRGGVRDGIPRNWKTKPTVFDEMCDRVGDWLLESKDNSKKYYNPNRSPAQRWNNDNN